MGGRTGGPGPPPGPDGPPPDRGPSTEGQDVPWEGLVDGPTLTVGLDLALPLYPESVLFIRGSGPDPRPGNPYNSLWHFRAPDDPSREVQFRTPKREGSRPSKSKERGEESGSY